MRYFKKVEDWFFIPKFVFCTVLVVVATLFGLLATLASVGHFDSSEWMSDVLDTVDRIMG